jgi:hypothetical protein
VGARKKATGWTAAGGARAARDARIATSRFLREAPIARRWHAAKFQTAHQVRVEHLRTQTSSEEVAHNTASALLVTGMGYPASWRPADWTELVDTVLDDESRHLAEADLYVVSPRMCDVVVAAAQTLTLEDLTLLAEDDLPTRSGLVVLAYPLLVRAINGNLGDDRAMMWRTPVTMAVPTESGTVEPRPAVRMTFFYDTHGPVRPDSFQEFAALARAQGHPLPPLLLESIRCLPFGMAITDEQRQTLNEFGTHARRDAARRQADLADHGMDETRVIGEYTPGTEIDDHDDTFSMRFLYAFWRLCEQRIAEISPAQTGHAARVTAERAGVSPAVRVVQLRTTTPATPDGDEPAAGRWHHRWVVRMHKVRQWYPIQQRHKVIYRGPYLKGPDDKPLLGGEVIRGLTR